MRIYHLFFIAVAIPFLYSCGDSIIVEEYDIFGSTDQRNEMASHAQQLTKGGDFLKCVGIPAPNDRYVYPYALGTQAWIDLNEEAVQSGRGTEYIKEKLQIPQETLNSMSTEAVVWAYLEYPLFEISYANNYKFAASQFLKLNPAGPEMLKRNNMVDVWYEYYLSFNPTGCSYGIDPFYSRSLEITISLPEICDRLSTKQRKEIVRFALDNIELRKANGLSHHNEATCRMIASLLYASNVKGFVKDLSNDENFSRWFDGDVCSLNDYSVIIAYAKDFVS